MDKKRIFIVGMTAALFLISAAGVFYYYQESRSPTLTPVKISSVEGKVEGFLTDIIKTYGIDKKNGLDITAVKTDSHTAQNLVKERKVDAGVYHPVSVAKEVLAGNQLRVFAPYRWNVTSVLVNKDSPYFSLNDLRGKKIGFDGSKDSSNYVNMRISSNIIGFNTETDCKAVFSPKESVSVEKLSKKEIDAAVIAEPLVSKFLGSGKYREVEKIRFLWQKKYGLPLPCNSLTAYDDWLLANKETARKLNKTFVEAANFILSNPSVFDREKEALAGLGLTTKEEIRAFRINAPSIFVVRWGADIIEDIETLIKISAESGLLERVPEQKIIINPIDL